MADNTILQSGSGGDTVRTLDRLTLGVKTETMQIDAGGPEPAAESLVSGQNPLPVTSRVDRLEAWLAIQQATLLANQARNGFVPQEITGFLGAL